MKIAVNVVQAIGRSQNVLPELMRRWFGPSAGLPGTDHWVELRRGADRVHRLVQADQPGTLGQVIAFPAVPYFRDLRAACGTLHDAGGLTEHETERLWVERDDVDPARHFVVQAEGGSMAGGLSPIHDGDLVLCEHLTAVSADQVQGTPCLLAGVRDGQVALATIKIPLRTDDGWILRSAAPGEPDQALPPGARLTPIGPVLGVVDQASGLQLWGRYSREAAVRAFGDEVNQSWLVGHRDIEVRGEPHTVLFVNLLKGEKVPVEQRYADRFISPTEFQWESQASTTPESKKGRSIIDHREQGRRVHLFVR